MSQVIAGQVSFVVTTLCNGMMLMAGYDIVRVLRWLIPHSRLWIAVGDITYWILAAIPTFFLFFHYNEGIIRWYGLLSLLAGAVLYERGISAPIRGCLSKWAGRWKRLCGQRWNRHKKKLAIKRMKKMEKKEQEIREEEK